MAFCLLSAWPMDFLRASRCASRLATACSVRLALCCALASWRAAEMNSCTWACRSLDSCSRTDAWFSTACGLSVVNSAPIEVMVPLSYAVEAIEAISSCIDRNFAWSVWTSRFTRVSRCLAWVSCCAVRSYCWTAWSCSEVRWSTVFCTWPTLGCGAAPATLAMVARSPAVAAAPAPRAIVRRSALRRCGFTCGSPCGSWGTRACWAAERVLTYVSRSFFHSAYRVS